MLKQLARAVFTLLLCALMIGFGLCGTFGVFSGIEGSLRRGIASGPGDAAPFLGYGALGLGIAWICWRGLLELWRKPPSDP